MLITVIIFSIINFIILAFNFFAIRFIVKRVNEIAEFKIAFPKIIERMGLVAQKLEAFLQLAKEP